MSAGRGSDGDSPLNFAARMKRDMEERATERKRRASDMLPSQGGGSSAAPIASPHASPHAPPHASLHGPPQAPSQSHPGLDNPPTLQTDQQVPSQPGKLVKEIAESVR